MRIQLYSDLHLELQDNFQAEASGDVIVLAGDNHQAGKVVDWAVRTFGNTIPIVIVAGNHEFYKGEFPGGYEVIAKSAKRHSNVHFLEQTEVEIQGTVFLGATLWTNYQIGFDDANEGYFHALNIMNDYQMISDPMREIINGDPVLKKYTIHPSVFHRRHADSVKWLFNRLEQHKRSNRKTVVVTHHAPSINSLNYQHEHTGIQAFYASELDEAIKQNGPDLWLHGHVHYASDYTIGSTRVVCNPRGYEHDDAGPQSGYNGFSPSGRLVL